MTSLALHGAAVAVMLIIAYASSFDAKKEPPQFELVAGAGDNFATTEAPALGTPDGIKLNVPTTPTPKAEPVKPEPVKVAEPEPQPPKPEPVKPEPTPVTPPPTPTPTPKPDAKTKPPTKERTLTEQFIRKTIVAESAVKMKAIAEKKKQEKERLEREKAEKAEAAKVAKANAARVDVAGIVAGVKGGSTNNKTGGAGGKALTRPDGPVMDAYFGMLKQRLISSLNKTKPPGLSDTLFAVAEFTIGSSGAISGVHITTTSGNTEFDDAVRAAFSVMERMPERPDKRSSTESLTFRTKDLEGN